MSFHRSHEVGASLVALLTAVAVFGILAMVISQMLANGNAAQNELQAKTDAAALRRYVLSATDCAATIAAMGGPCSVGDAVAVKSANKTIVQHASGGTYTKIGDYSVRARCAACTTCSGGKKLLVEFAKLSTAAASGFSKSQLSGKDRAWTDVNKGIPIGCVLP